MRKITEYSRFIFIFDNLCSPMLQAWASHLGPVFVLNVFHSPQTFIKINYTYDVKGLLYRIGMRQNRWQFRPCFILRSLTMLQIFGPIYIYSACSRLPRAAHIQTIWPIKVLSRTTYNNGKMVYSNTDLVHFTMRTEFFFQKIAR